MALQNPWWQFSTAIKEDDKVHDALNESPSIRLVPILNQNILYLGPRQVGKSTQIKLWINDLLDAGTLPQNILYYSCEPLFSNNALIELITEFDTISRNLPGTKYIFLDEITSFFNWETELKFIIESALGKNKIIIATGSNAIAIKQGIERLPGRDIHSKLFLPLSFCEYVTFFGSPALQAAMEKINFRWSDLTSRESLIQAITAILPFQTELMAHLNDFFQTGGYLKAIFEYRKNHRIRSEIYETYVKWILGDLSKLGKNEHIFRTVVTGIIKTQKTKFSLNALTGDSSTINHSTTQDYLQTIEQLFLIIQLFQREPDSFSLLFRKERKTYFRDPFLFSVFSGYTLGVYQNYSVNAEPYLIEGIICETLARAQMPSETLLLNNSGLGFYTGKKEVDFIVNVDPVKKQRVGIEVKWQNKVTIQDFHHANLFSHRIILSKKTLRLDDNTLIVPACLFLPLFRIMRD
jgi:predicted AAA+ superfamily ATPase